MPSALITGASVWAAGNVVDPMAQVPIAPSTGAIAGARIDVFPVEEDPALATRRTARQNDGLTGDDY